jgi:hypothetical protein
MTPPPSAAPAGVHSRARCLGSAPISTGAIAVAAFAFGLSLRDESAFASTAVVEDDDNDGLSNPQEVVLGTSILLPDSDYDGFSDLEELARSSDPTSSASVPTSTALAAGMAAHALDGEIKSLTAVYFPSGQTSGWLFNVGVRIGGTLFPLPPSTYLTGAVLQSFGGISTTGAVLTLSWSFQQSLLETLGDASIFCTLANAATGKVEAAAALNLVDLSGTPAEIHSNQTGSGSAPGGGFGSSSAGSTYRPLTGSVPASWSPDHICEQITEPIGTSGPVIILEIISADCVSADSYCPSTCSGLAGGVIRVVDPFSLVGG